MQCSWYAGVQRTYPVSYLIWAMRLGFNVESDQKKPLPQRRFFQKKETQVDIVQMLVPCSGRSIGSMALEWGVSFFSFIYLWSEAWIYLNYRFIEIDLHWFMQVFPYLPPSLPSFLYTSFTLILFPCKQPLGLLCIFYLYVLLHNVLFLFIWMHFWILLQIFKISE